MMLKDNFEIIEKSVDVISKFASEELEKYLCIAGLENKNGADIKFYLSQTEEVDKEGYFIEIKEDSVIIKGNKNGILYGVYEFLEKHIGFSFASYGETAPDKSVFELKEGVYTKKGADLSYRGAIIQFGVWADEADRALTPKFIDWLGKNRYNRIVTWVSVYEKLKKMGMIPEFEKRGIALTVGHHQSLFTFLPPYGNEYFPQKYLETNPEYFRLEADGSRFKPTDYSGQLVLCTHNEQCIETFSKNVVSWAKQNPQVDTVTVWPNDFSSDYCNCDKCRQFSKMENYLYFGNEVAKKVRNSMPHIKVDMLIYSDLWKCPESFTEFDESVVIDQANWSGDGVRKIGAKDGGSFIGTDYDNNIKSYKKLCKTAVVYDYYMGNYNARQKVMSAVGEMQSIFRHYIAEGISGSATQMECFNHWNNLFNFYSFARMQYDTDISFEQSLFKFCEAFKGSFEIIADIIRKFENAIDGSRSIREAGISLFERIDTDEIYSLFDKALAVAKNSAERNNIRMLRMAFRYSHLITIDKTEDKSREPDTVTYIDKTGELAYMSKHFDSHHNKDSMSGISIPVTNKSDVKPDSIWYDFE